MKEIKYPVALLGVFVLIAFFFPLSLAPLFDLDEGAFSEATREMLVGKDYITTYLNGELRFDKPILIYWLQLMSVHLFGINEFAFRLPSAIAGALWAWVIYTFTKSLHEEKTAFFAALFMIASLQINMISKAAIADALLNLFIVLSMFKIYRYYLTKEAKYIYYTFLFMGLGALTKGPVAIMIPLVSSLIFFSLKKEISYWLKAVFNPVGILIFALITLPWYIAEYMAQGDAFIDGFFLKHNISRFNASMESHSGSVFYFIPIIILGMMPFTYFILKPFTKVKSYIKDDLSLYLLIWFAFVFIFFSFSSTKLPHYIIYGYTPLFILAAMHLDKSLKKVWLILPLIIFLIILLFLPEIAQLIKGSVKDKLAIVLIDTALDTFDLNYRILLVGMLIVTFGLLLWKVAHTYIMLTLAFVMIVTVNYIVIPTYGKLMQLPVKEAALLAKQRGYNNIIMYKVNMPSFNVYYEGLVRKDQPKVDEIVFTKVTNVNDFKQYETLYRKNGFILLKVEK